MNSCGEMSRTAPNFGQKSSSMPSASSCSKRSRKRVSRGGAVAGEKNSFGVGSNVNTSEEPRELRGGAARALEDGAVADVQTIEHADRDRTRPARGPRQRSERPVKPHTDPYATDRIRNSLARKPTR